MSIVKSFSVGYGDMYYIRHNSDNFTVIDCCNYGESRTIDVELFDNHRYEIIFQSSDKSIKRFISTHPDDDHISGLSDYCNTVDIMNFYCVENATTKDDESDDFDMYCSLRDSKKAFYLRKGCKRKWLNIDDDVRDSSGIKCLWPDTSNAEYKVALKVAKEGGSPNNISPILTYSAGETKFMWMGDLESDFLKKVKDCIVFPKVTILFAPHHGRDSGKIPKSILKKLDPEIIVIGEAASEDLNYYDDYNTVTQNSAGDIVFETCDFGVNVYVGDENYSVDYLENYERCDDHGCYYIGTLEI